MSSAATAMTPCNCTDSPPRPVETGTTVQPPAAVQCSTSGECTLLASVVSPTAHIVPSGDVVMLRSSELCTIGPWGGLHAVPSQWMRNGGCGTCSDNPRD